MSIKSAPYFWLVCDRCGDTSTQDSEYAAWGHIRDAVDHAEDTDWWVEGGNHLCYECQPHPPEWDDEHEAAQQGIAPLDCSFCVGSPQEA